MTATTHRAILIEEYSLKHNSAESRRSSKLVEIEALEKMELKERVYVTYLYPIQFIVHDNEQIDFPIEEINSLSYNHTLLHRIIGTINNTFEGSAIEYIVCGDGALGVRIDGNVSKDALPGHYNDLLCKLFLGGMKVEAITSRDITTGDIYESKSIWPVSFGESWNSHIHAELRMRVVGVTDAIILYQPENRTISIEEMNEMLNKGTLIVDTISNLSTFHLLNGITEYKHCNWQAALTYLWVIAEEITDWLWAQKIINNVTGDNAKKRKEMLKDTRTFPISVKQEVLMQTGVLNENEYNSLFVIRQARNKLIHEGKMISEKQATLLYDTVNQLLSTISGSTNLLSSH